MFEKDSKINRMVHLSVHLFALGAPHFELYASTHSLFQTLASSSLPLTTRTVCNARSKCRLLQEPVSYVRNRSLLLVPPGVARSLRKHVRMRVAVERLERASKRASVS